MPEVTDPPVTTTGNPEGGDGGDPPKKSESVKLDLTQEQLNQIIADRVKRAIPEDYEELKALKVKQDEEKEKEKTELQKAQDAAKKSESEAKKAVATANARLMKAAILAEAAQAGALDSEIVVMALAGSDKITVDKDGEVLGAKEAVAAFLAEKPFLVKGNSPRQNGGEFGGTSAKTIQEKIAELEASGDHKEARRLKTLNAYLLAKG